MTNDNIINTSHQTLSWFEDQNKQGNLDLRPSFQRRPVWLDEEKSFLIDSILRGYPVPEVYIQSSSDYTPARFAVVDGQQRLRACLEYLADGFAVAFNTDKLQPLHSVADTPWFGRRFSQLTLDEQRRFRRYKLIVRDLEEMEDVEVRHLFYRLNQSNVALNSQELRYSIYQGGLLAAVEELIERPEWDHFRLFTKQQRRRMLDSEYVSELVIGYLHGPQNKKDTLDAYYRQYATSLPPEREVMNAFDTTLRFLQEAFPTPHFGGARWYKKSDFYTLFLAISRGALPADFDRAIEFAERLTKFSELISRQPSSRDDPRVEVYRDAVERAATDRARRTRREVALVAFMLDRNFEMEPMPDDAELSDATDIADALSEEADEEYEDQTS